MHSMCSGRGHDRRQFAVGHGMVRAGVLCSECSRSCFTSSGLSVACMHAHGRCPHHGHASAHYQMPATPSSPEHVLGQGRGCTLVRIQRERAGRSWLNDRRSPPSFPQTRLLCSDVPSTTHGELGHPSRHIRRAQRLLRLHGLKLFQFDRRVRFAFLQGRRARVCRGCLQVGPHARPRFLLLGQPRHEAVCRRVVRPAACARVEQGARMHACSA